VLSFIRWKEEVELFIRRIYVDEAKEKYMVEINNSRGVAKPTRFMGAYGEVVLAGCFSTDVKAVVVIVIVATTARHSTTKRRAVNDNNMEEVVEIQCSTRRQELRREVMALLPILVTCNIYYANNNTFTLSMKRIS
jgi:hypothetical protein